MQTKSTKPLQVGTKEVEESTFEDYDFGLPEVFPIELTPTLTINVREPTVTDFARIEELVKETKKDTEMLVKVLCLLHVPDEGRPRLSVKNAMKLRSSQIKKVSKILMPMITMEEDKEAEKSEPEEEL
jgi:hypothetical protein